MIRSILPASGLRKNRRQFIQQSSKRLAAAAMAGFVGDVGCTSRRKTKLGTRILGAEVGFIHRPLAVPLELSSGIITEVTEARTSVSVRADGKEATGHGSVYLSDLWSWPDPAYTHAQRDAALRNLCRQFASNLDSLCGGEDQHPLELGLRLHHSVTLENHPPFLARIMCASPFDAAIHDAVGIALQRSAFDFYEEQQPIPSADEYFPDEGTCRAISSLMRSKPLQEFQAWWIVGARDSLGSDIPPKVKQRGYRSFKLKLLGGDVKAQVQRTIEVFRWVKDMGVVDARLTLDSNEGNPDAASVLESLSRLRSADPEAFAAVQYLEQPTSRDILQNAYNWDEVTALKPVLLDEGLTDLELFPEIVRQGWSGIGLKTCKGHSFALVAGAWAHKHDLLVSLQDLTNPGLAAIHAALLAAHFPTVNGVELNSPQFTPAANNEWLPRLSGLFEPREGVHRLDFPVPVGLGSVL